MSKKGRIPVKRILLLALTAVLMLSWFSARAEERPVLTIGDVQNRSSSRVDGEKQVRFWRYIEDQLGMDIQFVYMTPEVYAAGLSSGDLPDIVATDNNLATILDNGVAFNAGPYLEEYVPNFLQGKARTAYDVFTALMDEEEGFYFFSAEDRVQRHWIQQWAREPRVRHPLGLL